MSHKGGYGGKTAKKSKWTKRWEATMGRALSNIYELVTMAYQHGYNDGKGKTTTCSGSAVSPVSKHRKRGGTHRAAEKK